MRNSGNKPVVDGEDELEAILDELATKIHNLPPGDVGSIDRVLLHIRQAKEKLVAREKEAERRGRIAQLDEDNQLQLSGEYGAHTILWEDYYTKRLRQLSQSEKGEQA